MTWFAELAPCDYFQLEQPDRLRAVGWLGRHEPFDTGAVEEDVIPLLLRALANPWQPFRFTGWHDCELCGEQDGPRRFDVAGEGVWIGTGNLFVPSPLGVLVAPSMIVHYIHEHQYRPPGEFIEALRSCPSMGTRDYFDALRRAGGDDILECLRLSPTVTGCGASSLWRPCTCSW